MKFLNLMTKGSQSQLKTMNLFPNILGQPKRKYEKLKTLNLERLNRANLMVQFHVAFPCKYDVIRLHHIPRSSNYDDVMTKQVSGVSGANFVGQHILSVPKGF